MSVTQKIREIFAGHSEAAVPSNEELSEADRIAEISRIVVEGAVREDAERAEEDSKNN